jgi:hypothetical protein
MRKVKFVVSRHSYAFDAACLFVVRGTAKCTLKNCVHFQCKRSYHSFIDLSFIPLTKHGNTADCIFEKQSLEDMKTRTFFKSSAKMRYLEFLITYQKLV